MDPEPRADAAGIVVSDLAEALVNRSSVDWLAAESAADPVELPVVRALQEAATVFSAHGELLAKASPPPLQAGDLWGHLEVRGRLGSGGFGEVYDAFDPKIERATALKILDAPDASDEGLLQEARLLAKVNHPNVVKVYGADRLDDRVGISMERLEGHTLTDEIRQFGPMSSDDATVIGMKLCDALAEVHRQGIVHRDVKAQNVMRAEGGRIVLMDFGIGLHESAGPAARPAGTPTYLAPELLTGGAPGVAADVYALGVLLFHLVTGTFPVLGRSVSDLRTRHEKQDVRHLLDLRPGLPEPFVEVVEKALDPDPGQRFGSAGAFHRALARVMESSVLGGEVSRSRIGRKGPGRRALVYGFLWVALVTALVWYFWPEGSLVPTTPILLAPLSDSTGQAAFDASADAALRSAIRSSAVFEPADRAEVVQVSREMSRSDPRAPWSDEEVFEAALRSSRSAVVGGEVFPSGGAWRVQLWLAPATDPDLRATAEQTVAAPTSAALDSAIEQAVSALESQAVRWLEPEGPLRETLMPLESATTPSLAALRFYTEGRRAYRPGDIGSAEQSFRRALQEDPRFALAHLQLGHCLAAQGDPQSALSSVQRAYELREQTSSDLERLTIEGAYFGVVRQYEKAIATYRQVLEIQVDDPTTLRQIALAYRELGDLDNAIRFAQSGLYGDGSESINHGLLVYLLATGGSGEAALREADGIHPRFEPTPYLELGKALALLVLDRPVKALQTTRNVMEEAGPDYRNLASWMEARVQIYSGNLDEASEILYRDRRKDAVEGTDFLEMRRRTWAARLQWIEGRPEQALEILRSLDLPMIPSHMTGWRSVAVLRTELGDSAGAQEILGKLEALRTEYPGLLADLVAAEARAAVLTQEGRAAEAVEVLSAHEAQSDVSYLRTLARAHVALGQWERAASYDARLIERRGELVEGEFAGLWVEALVRRARCLERLGRPAEASDHWSMARAHWGTLADRSFGAGGAADVLP
ncbi:MAG: DUF3856 domain-containing protein [Thermoanaerobaculia bacterium]|nr:DUF3856 domain-containing protein [Thermoanaerobaculia bacterium]